MTENIELTKHEELATNSESSGLLSEFSDFIVQHKGAIELGAGAAALMAGGALIKGLGRAVVDEVATAESPAAVKYTSFEGLTPAERSALSEKLGLPAFDRFQPLYMRPGAMPAAAESAESKATITARLRAAGVSFSEIPTTPLVVKSFRILE